MTRRIGSIAEGHPYDFGKEPRRYDKCIGVAVTRDDFLMLRDYACRRRTSMGALIRELLEPALVEIRSNPLPDYVEVD